MALYDTIGCLVRLFSDGNTPTLIITTVKSVDKNNNTIDALPIEGGADILDARLLVSNGSGANIVAYPKQGTFALIGAIEELFFVLAIDEWEEFLMTDNAAFECRVSGGKMVFNQGENNSDLLILPRLLQELDKVSDFMEALKSSLNAVVPVPGDGGLAIKTVVSAALSATDTLLVSNMGNNKIRH